MTRISKHVVEAGDLSEAWLDTVELVRAGQDRKLFHTVTMIKSPLTERAAIRAACDRLLAELDMAPIETIASTIFPAAMAATCGGPEHLVDRYRAAYPTIRRFNGNDRGTYFGRLVQYPAAGGDVDQLTCLIKKLASEAQQRGPMGARYEVDIASTTDLIQPEVSAATTIHAADRDHSRMGFPCLSMCSFQLDHGSVHLLAHYRYEYLIERGYGNYLGLARLLNYVASSAGLDVGKMTVITGRAHVDAAEAPLSRHLLASLFDTY